MYWNLAGSWGTSGGYQPSLPLGLGHLLVLALQGCTPALPMRFAVGSKIIFGSRHINTKMAQDCMTRRELGDDPTFVKGRCSWDFLWATPLLVFQNPSRKEQSMMMPDWLWSETPGKWEWLSGCLLNFVDRWDFVHLWRWLTSSKLWLLGKGGSCKRCCCDRRCVALGPSSPVHPFSWLRNSWVWHQWKGRICCYSLVVKCWWSSIVWGPLSRPNFGNGV